MNTTIQELFARKSMRVYEDTPIAPEKKSIIIESALQAPTAGNQILYTILDVQDAAIKKSLAVFCDNQPFIASAPLVLVFLADCRKWYDAYTLAGAVPRAPGVGDLLLACADACIAAQNSVIAAHSLGIGSCYIGDILENREKIVELLRLDDYVVPACMLVYGYPTHQQLERKKPRRFDAKYIVQQDRYAPLEENDLRAMFAEQSEDKDFAFEDELQKFCARKYNSDFAREMTRSAGEYIRSFK